MLFAERGFSRTTIRAVAADAGVDPSLVHHYFGSKDDLFMAALALPIDPRELLATVVAAGPDGAGERLVRTLLSAWDDPQVQPALLAVARSVIGDDGARLVTEGFIPVVVGPALAALVVDRPERAGPARRQPAGGPDRDALRPGRPGHGRHGARGRRRTPRPDDPALPDR